MDPNAMAPFGWALIDFHRGGPTIELDEILDDGWSTKISPAAFFRDAQEFALEKTALGLCVGRVLDVGAGTGIHSLFLQNNGFKVCAIDVVPECVTIMRERGVADARLAEVMSFQHTGFRTVLMLGHGIGMAGDIPGLDRLLAHLHSLLGPAGQVLTTSIDIRQWKEPHALEYTERNKRSGRYAGEMRMHLKYKGLVGPEFSWLHVDPETLSRHSLQEGFAFDVIQQGDDANYLARLSRAD